MTPFALAQVLVTGLHDPELHTDCATGAEQTGAWSVSSGSGLPAARSATQVSVLRSQCWLAAQSESAQQASERKGTQAPLALHTPDWQVAALALVQPVCPSARPHLPLAPHTLLAHCDAPAQSLLTVTAQVLVVALHVPLAQVGARPVEPQWPSCRPSSGMAAPASSFTAQVELARSQYCAAPQSASAQQPPAGMHVPETEQAPDWHLAALAAVHPGCPSARPHWPLLPHALVAHSLAFEQLAPLAAAQVFVCTLHRPVPHAPLTPLAGHAVCRPSPGN